jgi:putative transposase
LTAHTHLEQVRADRRIGYDALFGARIAGDESPIPEQLSIEDITEQNGTSA